MEKQSNQSKLCKIIYFDQDSVTDYLQLTSGGSLEKTTELLNASKIQGDVEANATTKGGLSGLLSNLIGWKAEIGATASLSDSFNSDKMVKNIIKNTILTDFVNIIEDTEEKKAISKLPKGTIKKFKDYKISAEKDSLSYFVMISPYMNMFQTGSVIPSGELNISLEKLDNALRNAKGYYEFVGTKGKSKIVLRFNINSFKNNYMISDLMKMNLSIFAVKVGDTTLDMLDVNNELGLDLPKVAVDNPSYEDEENMENEIENKTNFQRLPVFDVLLAGVESDG
ncbi:DUF6414 family protein [Eubacterium limosum]|uniref:DUF6414 family protein n=1 Tax=Eubacterium limosum TaxID=1736 RepID=UPI0010635EEE|nr:DUF6414 family protein [Eubacterium limosum]